MSDSIVTQGIPPRKPLHKRRWVQVAAVIVAAFVAFIVVTSVTSKPSPAVPKVPHAAPARPVTQAPTAPANPVTLVQQAGATPSPGEKYGTSVVDGSLRAGGTYGGGTNPEQIAVYTLPAGVTGHQILAQGNIATSDSQTVILGPDFYILVGPYLPDDGSPGTYPVSPTVIATRVHGTVTTPAS